MAFSSSIIEVPIAVQRAQESQTQRYASYLQRGLDETQVNDQIELEEEAELDTCWSWCVCIGALLVNTFVIGIHHAYGVILIAIQNEFDVSLDTASWVGSLSYGISSFLGPVSGFIFNKIGHRACATIGTSIAVCGLIGSSFARDFSELCVSYVFMFGFGSSLAYTPSVVVCNNYFDRHLGLATGIQISGTMVGGIILPPVCQVLITSVGFRATMRVLAGIACLGLVGSSTFTGKQEAPQEEPQSQQDRQTGAVQQYLKKVWVLLNDPAFFLWASIIALVHFGGMTPNVHMVSRGLDIGLSLAEASSVMSVIAVASALSRIGFGRMLDYPRISLLLMVQLAIALMGLSLMLVPAVVNMPLMLVFALSYGTMEGFYVDLVPLYTLRLTGTRSAGIAWGLIIGSCSIPWIVGPYLAGLMRARIGSYDLAFVMCGAVMVIGSALLFAMPLCLKKRRQAQDSAEDTEEQSMIIQGIDVNCPGIGPIFGYISIQDMPPSYRQQIRFRPGKTQQLRHGGMMAAPSTAQTISNLEIPPTTAETQSQPHQRPTSRSQEVVSSLAAPFEYDSLAALRRRQSPQPPPAALQSVSTPAETSSLKLHSEPELAMLPSGLNSTPLSTTTAVAPGTGASELRHIPTTPLPPQQLPPGYEALPVAGYLVLTPGSDQARFVVVDSRAGQALMLHTSLVDAPADLADEQDAELQQMLDTIVEESRSNITVVDAGEIAHERFSQVRAAVTGWHAHQEADEMLDDVVSLQETRSVEVASVKAIDPESAELGPASRSCDDVAHLGAHESAEGSPLQRSISPSNITLSEVARSQEWQEPGTSSSMSDRARSSYTRNRRRGVSVSKSEEAGSISNADRAESLSNGTMEASSGKQTFH